MTRVIGTDLDSFAEYIFHDSSPYYRACVRSRITALKTIHHPSTLPCFCCRRRFYTTPHDTAQGPSIRSPTPSPQCSPSTRMNSHISLNPPDHSSPPSPHPTVK